MPMNNAPPMGSADRIRRLAAAGYGQFGAKSLGQATNHAHPSGIDIGGSAPLPPAPPSPYGQPSGSLNDNIQQDFNAAYPAPQMLPPQPLLPPDAALNTPVQYHPITGTGYVAGARDPALDRQNDINGRRPKIQSRVVAQQAARRG